MDHIVTHAVAVCIISKVRWHTTVHTIARDRVAIISSPSLICLPHSILAQTGQRDGMPHLIGQFRPPKQCRQPLCWLPKSESRSMACATWQCVCAGRSGTRRRELCRPAFVIAHRHMPIEGAREEEFQDGLVLIETRG